MTTANRLNSVVSVFRNAFAKSTDAPVDNLTVRDALEHFRTGRQNRAYVVKARAALAAGRKAESQDWKERTRCYTFSGRFSGNSKDKCLAHSGLVVVDFDADDEAFDFDATWTRLVNDPHVASVFRSTRGEGIKALVAVAMPPAPTDFYHKQAFQAVEERYKAAGWDGGGKDLNRYCFGTIDPDLYVNDQAVPIRARYIEEEERTPAPVSVGTNGHAVAASVLLERAEREAEETGRNAAGYWLAQQMHWNGYGRDEALTIAPDFVSRVQALGDHPYTLDEFERSVDQAFKLERREPWGMPSMHANGQTTRQSHEIASCFWYYEERGESKKLKIDQSALVDSQANDGFAKLYSYGADTSTLVRRDGLILEPTSREKIKDHSLRYAEGIDGPLGNDVLSALRRGANVYFSSGLLETLPVLDEAFQRDTREAAFFYFRNCFVRVTASGIETLPYDQLSGYIWRRQIIDRTFRQANMRLLDVEFGKFLHYVTGKDERRLRALRSSIGHLLHGHKDTARGKAIAFIDEGIDDFQMGRRGKSLTARAIGHLVPVEHIDARNFSFDTPFAFQQVTPATRVVHFNDASKHFPFERLFSLITDDMHVERKGRDRMTIPFSESPKFLLSTNFAVEGTGGSHRDRLFEIEYADYFNPRWKPTDEFGHNLFDDWDGDEWNRFDNLMLACVATYLKSGLQEYDHVSLELKKLAQMTSPEFADFVEPVVENDAGELVRSPRYAAQPAKQARDKIRRKEYDKKDEYRAFSSEFRGSDVEQKDFTRWLKTYAQIKQWSYDERRASGGSERFIWFIQPET